MLYVLAGLLLGCGVFAFIGYFARRPSPVEWGSDASFRHGVGLAQAADDIDDDESDAHGLDQQESDEDYLARERMMDYHHDQYMPNFHPEEGHGAGGFADSSY